MVRPRIALIGQFEYAQEAVAWRLVDGGIYDVDVGTQGVGSATDLLLVTVSAIDGPMPSLPSALETSAARAFRTSRSR